MRLIMLRYRLVTQDEMIIKCYTTGTKPTQRYIFPAVVEQQIQNVILVYVGIFPGANDK